MALFWLFCLLTTHTGCCSVYCPHIRHAQLPIYKLSLATRLHGQWLIEDDLNKRSAKHTNKSTLVARGANTHSCILAPLATNVDLWNPIVMQIDNHFWEITFSRRHNVFILPQHKTAAHDDTTRGRSSQNSSERTRIRHLHV